MTYATFIIIQASMRYHSIKIGTPPEVKDCLPEWIQQEFEYIKPINTTGVKTCFTPGRFVVTMPCDELIILGNMASVDAHSVHMCESYARMIGSPLAEFLRICVKHDLCLNKYLVAKTRFQI